jgi:hypothetical protein
VVRGEKYVGYGVWEDINDRTIQSSGPDPDTASGRLELEYSEGLARCRGNSKAAKEICAKWTRLYHDLAGKLADTNANKHYPVVLGGDKEAKEACRQDA